MTTNHSIVIRTMEDAEATVCENILRSLPQWFGIEEAIVEYCHDIKTMGPSKPDPHYDRTRNFYEATGFRPIEETNLWGDKNPCLIMIKHLLCEHTAS